MKKAFLLITVLSSFYVFSQNINEKTPTVLILPSYDLYANGGFSPEIQYSLEEYFLTSKKVKLIKFPLKKLSNIPYQNVFDKKYIEPIIAKVKVDYIILSKLDLYNELDTNKKWDLSFRIIKVNEMGQKNSNLFLKKSTKTQIEKVLSEKYETLIEEIQKF